MEDYKKIFDKLYSEEQLFECPPENKLQFLGNSIFDFTTYDSDMDELFAKKMLEVIECVLNKGTFKYQQESEDNYINYLTMVNMSFLYGKLEWGTSIRGAWFDEYGHHTDTKKVYDITYDWAIPKSEIKNFMRELIEWSKE